MESGQALRAAILRPLLAVLIRLRVTPDFVTLVGALLGIAFLPFTVMGANGIAIVCLALHVLIDGVDGPLARATHRESSRGSFTDTFADQIVVTFVMLAWMLVRAEPLGIANGAIYIFLYTLVVAMSMIRNAMEVPYSWLVRPRFFVYVAIAIDLMLASSWTLLVLAVANVLLAIKTVTGFVKLRSRLPGPQNDLDSKD